MIHDLFAEAIEEKSWRDDETHEAVIDLGKFDTLLSLSTKTTRIEISSILFCLF